MVKIAFFDAKSYDRESFGQINKEYGYDIHFYKERLSLESVELARGKDVVCIFVNDECNAAVIDCLLSMGIQLIALRCAGFNNVDIKAAKGKIPVVRVPAYSPHAVAEYAVALMLSLNRKIYRSVSRTREGNFKLKGLLGFDMYGKTVGVIGMGRIARELVRILYGFGMKILAYDLHPKPELTEQYGVKFCSLDEIYSQSDIISLHCPLTDDTRFIINKDSIAKMKDGVILINTARGPVVDSKALADALKEGRIAGAGIDVFEGEPPIAGDHPLLHAPNVILAPHVGFATQEAMEKRAVFAFKNVQAYLAGKPQNVM